MKSTALFLVLVLWAPANAGVPLRVHLDISAGPDLTPRLTSCLQNGFRKFWDVTLTDYAPNTQVSIIAVPIQQGLMKVGYALSVVTRILTFGKTLSDGHQSLHELRITSREDFEDVCAGIVADIDQETFEAARRP